MVANGTRGIILLVVALLLGIFILNKTQPGGTRTSVSSAGTRTTTTKATKGKGATTTTPPSTRAVRQPAAIKVLAANASGVPGLGSKTGDRLTAAGYNSLAPANARGQVPATLIEYAPGFDLESLYVAQALGLTPTPTSIKPLAPDIPVADTKGADIVVLVGPDLNTTTPTTAAGTATTALTTPTTAFRVTTTTTR